jgi:glutaredoxin
MKYSVRETSVLKLFNCRRIFPPKRTLLVFMAVFLTLMAVNPCSAHNNVLNRALIQETNAINTQPVDIEVYVRTGCPHCEKAEAFLEYLKRENPNLNILIHDLASEPTQLERLQKLAEQQGETSLRVPAFRIGEQLIIGYSDETTTGHLIRNALTTQQPSNPHSNLKSCEANQKTTCKTGTTHTDENPQVFQLDLLGYTITLDQVGLPLFTLTMGLLDGFNPCSLWVLLLMISLLAPMKERFRMFAIAGSFILVEGIAYFIFMTAWLNLFLFIGLSRISEIIIASIALLAGAINLKDFCFFGRGVSLSIPESAKPGIYAKMRSVLSAQNLTAAIIGAVTLAVLVQFVELMCTSGFPALFTRILTLKNLDKVNYYGYLLLYNVAYMFDDFIILTLGIITLSQKRLQESEGRWLKLISGLVMVGLGIYLLLIPG